MADLYSVRIGFRLPDTADTIGYSRTAVAPVVVRPIATLISSGSPQYLEGEAQLVASWTCLPFSIHQRTHTHMMTTSFDKQAQEMCRRHAKSGILYFLSPYRGVDNTPCTILTSFRRDDHGDNCKGDGLKALRELIALFNRHDKELVLWCQIPYLYQYYMDAGMRVYRTTHDGKTLWFTTKD